ncbi:MAG: cobalamin B12-binding domain-containing protein, partial [Chloroflexota bacterium]|nr:cobalamin B12-binding domain-containing protein [Chloroflexota bacterium]
MIRPSASSFDKLRTASGHRRVDKGKPLLLVNANTLSPPVSPVGLEYVAESLREHGLPVRVVDLAFEADPAGALRRALSSVEPLAVGVAVRNTDDCSWLSATSFLPNIRHLVSVCREATQAPVVLGGGGFSVAPRAILRYTGADMGIAGDGEEALSGLAVKLLRGEDILSQ